MNQDITIQELIKRVTALEQNHRRHSHDHIETDNLGISAFKAEGTSGQVLTSNGTSEAPSYQALPTPSASGWEIVEEGQLDSVSSFSVDNLDGDTDRIYQLILRIKFNVNESELVMTFNNDSGANYLYDIDGADPGASYQNNATLIDSAGTRHILINIFIHARSGVPRIWTGTNFMFSDTSNYDGNQVHGFWNNSVDNLTEISIGAGQNFQPGSEYILLKLS